MALKVRSTGNASSPGLLWVEARIRALSQEIGRPVDLLEWPRPLDPYGDGPLTLKLWRGGWFRVVEREAREAGRGLWGDQGNGCCSG